MHRMISLVLCFVLLLTFTGCLAHSNTPPAENETDPPVLTVTQSTDDSVDARQKILNRYGGEFYLRRSFGMELIDFTFSETSVTRQHLDSMKDNVPTHTGTWDIIDEELVIIGQWNETFMLDLDQNIAISKTDGEEYSISGKDHSLTMYGVLQDTILTYGFPIKLRMLNGMELTTVTLYEDHAICEWKSNNIIEEYSALSWAIDGDLLTISGEWEETLIFEITTGTAAAQSSKYVYDIFVIKDGKESFLVG